VTRTRDVATQGGLVLISSTTVGSAVSSVTVNNAFSATYDNYKILWTGGNVSTALTIRMTIDNQVASYENSMINGSTRAATLTNTQTSSSSIFWTLGTGVSVGVGPVLELEIFQPFLTSKTYFRGWNFGATSDFQQLTGGAAFTSASSTQFTFTASTGTFTGGTISVYGYKK
jgi:hypothetical protein